MRRAALLARAPLLRASSSSAPLTRRAVCAAARPLCARRLGASCGRAEQLGAQLAAGSALTAPTGVAGSEEVDEFCWQAARGLAAGLPRPNSAHGEGALADQGAALAETRSSRDALLRGADPMGSVRLQTDPTAEALRLDGWFGSADIECLVVEDADDQEDAEVEGMVLSSVLKKRRAKIKKHWLKKRRRRNRYKTKVGKAK